MAKTNTATLEGRVKALEARLAAIDEKDKKRMAAFDKFIKEISDVDTSRMSMIYKWAEGVTKDLHQLYGMLATITRAFNARRH